MQQLVFLALGGLEEIGLNCYLYGVQSKTNNNYIMVDLGIGFRDSKFSFIDTFLPDINFIKQKNNNLRAIFLTHGHEDHIGALEYHYKELKNIPIYATPFTADLVRSKLKFYNISNPKIIEVKFGKKYQVDEFTITFIPTQHSIPEAAMLLIETTNSNILHSGDFKINPKNFKVQNITKFLPKNVNYLFCDSTNANKNKSYSSEDSILPDLNSIIKASKGTIWVTLFSSNVERLNNLLTVAKSNKRKVVLLGASVQNYYNIASKHRLIKGTTVISLEEAAAVNKKELLYVVTGSQGEHSSFLQRVLLQEYKGLTISKGDSVIFLSKIIPGNEIKVNKIYNLIAEKNALLYNEDNYHLHVSGHPYQGQLELLINTVSPNCVIPMHGESLQLKALASLANKIGFKAYTFKNGEIVNLLAEVPAVVDNIPFNKLCFEGFRNLSLNDTPLKDRKKAMFEGVVTASLAVKHRQITDAINLNIIGLLTGEEQEQYFPILTNKILNLNNELSKQEINSAEVLKTQVKRVIKKFFKELLHKKPIITVDLFY